MKEWIIITGVKIVIGKEGDCIQIPENQRRNRIFRIIKAHVNTFLLAIKTKLFEKNSDLLALEN